MPGKPGAVTGDKKSHNSVTVSWAEPQNNGGAEITGYVLKYRPDGTDYDYTKTFPENHGLVDGLSSGTTYKFKVAAQNSAGVGIFSDSAEISTTGENETTSFQVWPFL